mmetsp:Transcript_36484/g.117150  ORF Transcript_36484/g.117150 Transcript_36484/m.117150 type:complete len:212 (-) Transcript_36484:258-893(-)
MSPPPSWATTRGSSPTTTSNRASRKRRAPPTSSDPPASVSSARPCQTWSPIRSGWSRRTARPLQCPRPISGRPFPSLRPTGCKGCCCEGSEQRCSPTVFRPCCSRCSGRRSTARSPGGGPPWPRAKPPRHACKQPAAPPGRLLRGKETAVDHRGVFGRAWPPAHAHQMGCCWGLSGTVRGHIVQRDAACTLFVLYTHRTVIAHLSRRSHVA